MNVYKISFLPYSLEKKMQNTIYDKTELTFITFRILETIRAFAAISKEGVTNFVVVTMITASELTALSIFPRTTCYIYSNT